MQGERSRRIHTAMLTVIIVGRHKVIFFSFLWIFSYARNIVYMIRELFLNLKMHVDKVAAFFQICFIVVNADNTSRNERRSC